MFLFCRCLSVAPLFLCLHVYLSVCLSAHLSSLHPSLFLSAMYTRACACGCGCGWVCGWGMAGKVRAMPSWQVRPTPVVFNEDDHGNLLARSPTGSNLEAAIAANASWGFLCCCDAKVQGDYSTGYQCPPVRSNQRAHRHYHHARARTRARPHHHSSTAFAATSSPCAHPHHTHHHHHHHCPHPRGSTGCM